jgi:hypothetical protein
MSDQQPIRSEIRVRGNLSGQVGVGHHIEQNQTTYAPVTDEDRAELAQAIADLRELIRTTADPAERDEALQRTDELEAAVTAETPKLSTIEYVRDWISDHVRPAAAAVQALVLSPILAKFVAAGGDALLTEFRRRFGG